MKTLVELKTRLSSIVSEVGTLAAEMKSDEAKATPENIKKLDDLTAEAEGLETEIKRAERVEGLTARVGEGKGRQTTEAETVIEPARVASRSPQSLGEMFVNSDEYKSSVRNGRPVQHRTINVEAKGFLNPSGTKATFDSTDTGLGTGVPYVGGIIPVEQQPLTIRDLLSVGQTTLNSIPFIRETSFTNAAAMVAEEGLKPEATFATEDDTAPVRKIAVIGRVTDEMYADFPMMRDYVNNRLRFMVQQTEEAQLLNGSGAGNNIKGILQTTGIQTQALGADTLADAVYRAINKVRTVGFFEPDGIVIHPNDYTALRLAKDANEQYYGGGYFSGAYGNGGVPQNPPLWGLRTIVTTAIAEGDPLVGAFRMGAQIWQREGINVATTDTDGEDWRYNRIAIRVEERLALTVYRPKAFCQVITT